VGIAIADRRLRLGMVGGGEGAFIGAVHRIASRIDDQYQLVAAAPSADPERARRSGAALGLDPQRVYASFVDMAQSERQRPDPIDVVAIVTPNHLHAPVAEVFLQAGFHVICDKPLTITLAQALLKGDKMDRVIRDAVMLGVAAIQPFTSARTEVPREAVRAGGRKDRWDRTVIASVKQCGRAVVPVVHPTLALPELLRAEHDVLCLMFVEPRQTAEAAKAGTSLESLETRVPGKATILIGPEGGWEPQEINAALDAGVTMVSLGERVLRADAAGALAIAVLQYVWKDF